MRLKRGLAFLFCMTLAAGCSSGHEAADHADKWGVCYESAKDLIDGHHYSEAAVILQTALTEAEASGDQKKITSTLKSLVQVKVSLKEFQSAEGFQRRIMKSIPSAESLDALIVLANILENEGKITDAEATYRNILAIYKTQKSMMSEWETLQKIASLCRKAGNNENAKQAEAQALELVRIKNLADLQTDRVFQGFEEHKYTLLGSSNGYTAYSYSDPIDHFFIVFQLDKSNEIAAFEVCSLTDYVGTATDLMFDLIKGNGMSMEQRNESKTFEDEISSLRRQSLEENAVKSTHLGEYNLEVTFDDGRVNVLCLSKKAKPWVARIDEDGHLAFQSSEVAPVGAVERTKDLDDGPDAVAAVDNLKAEIQRCYDEHRLADAIPLLKEAMSIQKRAGDMKELRQTKLDLENVKHQVAVEKAQEESQRKGSVQSYDMQALTTEAQNDYETGQYALAEANYKKAIASARAAGITEDKIAILLVDLAVVYTQEKNYPAARSEYEQALSIRKRVLGDDDPATLDTASRLNSIANR